MNVNSHGHNLDTRFELQFPKIKHPPGLKNPVGVPSPSGRREGNPKVFPLGDSNPPMFPQHPLATIMWRVLHRLFSASHRRRNPYYYKSLEYVCACMSLRTFPAIEFNDANISSPIFQKSLIDLGSKYNLYFCNFSISDIISAIFLIISLLNILASDALRLNISPLNSFRIFFPSSKFIGLLFFSLVQSKMYLSISSQNF